MNSILILLVLVACGGKQAPSAAVDNTTKPATGKEGDICAFGDEHRGSGVAVACGPGLNCCYPCGIDGCDSICRVGDCPTDIP